MSDPQPRKLDADDIVADESLDSASRDKGVTRATRAETAKPMSAPTRSSAAEGEEPTHSTRRTRPDRDALLAVAPVAQRRWVPPVFITVGLLGVLWLMVYYIAGYQIPQMAKLGNWNVLIGMGLMASSFIIATLWK